MLGFLLQHIKSPSPSSSSVLAFPQPFLLAKHILSYHLRNCKDSFLPSCNHKMAPLIINVTGKSAVQHLAERGVLYIAVKSIDLTQSKVGSDVLNACATLQNIFTQLSPKMETGIHAPNAAVTVWTMSLIKGFSKISHQRDESTPEKPHEYTASSSFEVTFQKFEEMGNLMAQLLEIPFVKITQTY